MYERMKCPTCKKNLFSASDECKEPNHAQPPDISAFKENAPREAWNFRLGRMVDIQTHELIERMAKK